MSQATRLHADPGVQREIDAQDGAVRRPGIVGGHAALADVGLDVVMPEGEVVPAAVANLVCARSVTSGPAVAARRRRSRVPWRGTTAGRRARECEREARTSARAPPWPVPTRARRARETRWSPPRAGGSRGHGGPSP